MAKLKRDKLFRRLEAHKEFMSPAERATHKRKRDARKKKEKRRAAFVLNANERVQMRYGITAAALTSALDPEDLTLPLPAETMAEVSEGKLK